MIAIEFNDYGLNARLDAVLGDLRNRRGLMAVLGRELNNRLKAHFRDKDKREPNKLDGRRQHFWSRVAQATQSPVVSGDGSQARVSVNHPAYAQKVYGGPIRAKRKKYLPIPQTADAYGRSPAVFERETGIQLFFLKTGRGGLLAARLEGAEGIKVHYVLKRELNPGQQKPDPTALPKREELEGAITRRAESFVRNQTDQL